MQNKTLISRGVSLALLMACGNAMAQQPEASDQLEEITVTAQFRSQNLQETPLAITAVTGDMLEARSQTSIYEVAAQAPSVFLAPQAQANGSGLIAYIRGVGQTDFNFALEPGVGLYVDDVYLPDADRLAARPARPGSRRNPARPAGHAGGTQLHRRRHQAVLAASRKARAAMSRSPTARIDRVDVRASGDFTLVDDKLFMRVAGVSARTAMAMSIASTTAARIRVPASRRSDFRTGCKLGTLGGISYAAGRMNLRWLPSDSVEVNFIADITNDSSEAGADVLRRAQCRRYRARRPRATSGWTMAIRTRSDRAAGLPLRAVWPDTAAIPTAATRTAATPRSSTPPRLRTSGRSSPWSCRWCSSSTSTACRPTSTGRSATLFAEVHLRLAQVRFELGAGRGQLAAASQQLLQSLRHWAWSQELRLNGSFGEAFDFTAGASTSSRTARSKRAST